MSGLSGLSDRRAGPPMIAPCDAFGPWSTTITPHERTARLRTMRAIVSLCCGPRGEALCDLLRTAETDETALEPAAAALGRLAALDYRRVLGTFAALHRPQPITRRNRPC